jgi:hypothetical protein
MSLTNGYDNRVALAQGAGFALVADIAMARLTPRRRIAVAPSASSRLPRFIRCRAAA